MTDNPQPDRPFRDEPTEVLEAALGLAGAHAEQAARFRPPQQNDALPAVADLFQAEIKHREEHTLPAAQGPEYRHCRVCAHIEPEHQPDAGPCLVCDCAAYQLVERSAWIDGDPLMEAIAAAVWEQCDISGGGAIVTDDPRNIAAVAAAVARPAVRAEAFRDAADICDEAGAVYASKTLNDHAGAAFTLMERFLRKADEAEYVATPCSIGGCEDGGEPCSTHERLMAHAEGDHELCGPDCGTSPSRMADEAQQPETQDATPEAPPVCEGFQWIGQSFATCERCGQPAWDHAGEEVAVEGAGVFDTRRTVRPWKPGQADAIRAKWEQPAAAPQPGKEG